MHLGIEGSRPGDGEQFIMPVGGMLDEQYMLGPVSKDRLEDLQLWSALQAIGRNGAALHPLGIRPGEDPPDRWLFHDDREWGTELTELTVEDLRQDLARVRMFSRQLQQRLRDRTADFQHLRGRTVMLVKRHEQVMPRDLGPMLTEFERVLAEDKGCVGEDMDFSQGVPQRLGERGHYGEHGVFGVLVNQTPGRSEIVISATSQIELHRSDVIAALGRRVVEKDEEFCNELLIVTCGRPDQKGYRCPSDHAMFLILQRAIQAGVDILPRKPTNIRGILIHLWDSTELISWTEGDDFPWSEQTGKSYDTNG